MQFLTALWLPILLSAVFVFIVSSIIHMVTPMHKGDYAKLTNEDAVLESLRAHGVTPGNYMFPRACSMKDMGSPEMIEKFNRGPVGWCTILPRGGMNIGKSLLHWFTLTLVTGIFVAYIAWHSLGPGAPYLTVFRITGATAVLGYAVGQADNSIWRGVRWGTSARFMIDGVIYGLITAGTFGWLWPAGN